MSASPAEDSRFTGAAGGGTPDDFARFIRSDVAKWQKLIRAANIKAD